jgi:hypothetical protein
MNTAVFASLIPSQLHHAAPAASPAKFGSAEETAVVQTQHIKRAPQPALTTSAMTP